MIFCIFCFFEKLHKFERVQLVNHRPMEVTKILRLHSIEKALVQVAKVFDPKRQLQHQQLILVVHQLLIPMGQNVNHFNVY